MNRKKQMGQGNAKALLAAALTIGAATSAFWGLTQVALAAQVGKPQTVQTSYPSGQAAGEQKKSQSVSNEKPTYRLVDNDLEYYRDKKPTSLDISREEAAERGVQGLYKVFGLDMDGKEIELAYNPAQGGHRATWEGNWWPDGRKSGPEAYVQSYGFSVDAVSGELHAVSHSRVLSQETNTGFDAGLSRSSGEYGGLARELAVKLGAVQGKVKTVDYAGQGTSNNDPDIFFNITGEGGERAQLRFSRFDQELLGVTFDPGMKEMDVSIRDAEEFAKRAEAYFKLNPDAATYEE